MNTDGKLDQLLKRSRTLAPGAGFEDVVWSRIRAVEPVRREWGTGSWLAAMAASLVLGTGLALLFPARPVTREGGGVTLVKAGSLTGAYLAMSSGGNHE